MSLIVSHTFCLRQAVQAATTFLGSGRSSTEPGPWTGRKPWAASLRLRFSETDIATGSVCGLNFGCSKMLEQQKTCLYKVQIN